MSATGTRWTRRSSTALTSSRTRYRSSMVIGPRFGATRAGRGLDAGGTQDLVGDVGVRMPGELPIGDGRQVTDRDQHLGLVTLGKELELFEPVARRGPTG